MGDDRSSGPGWLGLGWLGSGVVGGAGVGAGLGAVLGGVASRMSDTSPDDAAVHELPVWLGAALGIVAEPSARPGLPSLPVLVPTTVVAALTASGLALLMRRSATRLGSWPTSTSPPRP
jgi:hypothetical protein